MVLGRLTHYAFDAVLISAFLAGVKRSTGLTKHSFRTEGFTRMLTALSRAHPPLADARDLDSPSLNSDKVTDNKEIKKWVENYLGVGEWVMDQSVAVLGSTGWFERRR